MATLSDANPDDSMWAWGRDQHVRFWSRRQLHETLVHRMDFELAAQRSPEAAPEVALDAIDEFLTNFENDLKKSPGRSPLRGNGETLAIRSSDTPTLWSITLNEDGFVVTRDEGRFDAELLGSPVELLLIVLRRRGVDEGEVTMRGDRGLIDYWLTNSAFD